VRPRPSRLAAAAVALTIGAATLGAVPAVATRGDVPTTIEDSAKSRPQAGTPLVIGHRGASGYRPEHTLAAYALAIQMGADYIEPDLVSTKDGVLVARHENEISGTTDVADHPEFAARQATKVVDGVSLTGWFTEDFTLAELKTLRAKERIPLIRQENTMFDGRYDVPTLQQVVDLAKTASKTYGRTIGIYPETKHPTYFDSIGFSLEEPLVETLNRNNLNRPNAKVFVQSFETANLRELDESLRVPIVQLLSATGAPYDFVAAGDPRSYADLITPTGLRDVATYADGIGPEKGMVIPRTPDGALGAASSLVGDAHQAGLVVHPYTFRAENTFLPTNLRHGTDPAAYGDLFGELEAFLDAGVDGFFTDNPDIGRAAVSGDLSVVGGLAA